MRVLYNYRYGSIQQHDQSMIQLLEDRYYEVITCSDVEVALQDLNNLDLVVVGAHFTPSAIPIHPSADTLTSLAKPILTFCPAVACDVFGMATAYSSIDYISTLITTQENHDICINLGLSNNTPLIISAVSLPVRWLATPLGGGAVAVLQEYASNFPVLVEGKFDGVYSRIYYAFGNIDSVNADGVSVYEAILYYILGHPTIEIPDVVVSGATDIGISRAYVHGEVKDMGGIPGIDVSMQYDIGTSPYGAMNWQYETPSVRIDSAGEFYFRLPQIQTKYRQLTGLQFYNSPSKGYVDLSTNVYGYLKTAGAGTFEMSFIKREAIANSGLMVFGDNSERIFWLGITSGMSLTFWTNNGTGKTIKTGIGLNRLYHVAVTVTDNGEALFYLDGELVNNTNLTTWPSTASIVEIGRLSSGFGSAGAVIGDVRVWNAVRTPAQIKDNMKTLLQGNETNLVGWWPFNERHGSLINDRSTNSNNGTLGGTTAWRSDSDFYAPHGYHVSPPPSLINGEITYRVKATWGTHTIYSEPMAFNTEPLIDGFDLYRRKLGDEFWEFVGGIEGLDTTLYVDAGPFDQGTYEYQFACVNERNVSDMSTILTHEYFGDAPIVVTLSAVDVGMTVATLRGEVEFPPSWS